MSREQDKTRKALEIAIQMESDGKKFYLKAAELSSHELGRNLFRSLAAEEDVHGQKFVEIYEAINQKQEWPPTDFEPDGGHSLRTIFARAINDMDTATSPQSTELDAVRTAMDMESQTYDFYTEQATNAAYKTEREFYEALAIQEREHHLILLDYYEFLQNPSARFVSKEHSSLDGG